VALGFGLACAIAAVVLVAYGINFVKKSKKLII
jgi:L-lactate permease